MLEAVETILARHQAFGDSDYVQAQLQLCYERRLGKISAYLPVAKQLLESLGRAGASCRYRVLGDTVVRCAIQHALKQLETGTQYGLPLDECEEVFRGTIIHLEEDRLGGPLEFGLSAVNRLGSEPFLGWVWSEEHPDDVFGRSFRRLIQDNYGESLHTPSTDELALLAKGARLLGDLLPLLSRSALSHAHLIAVFPSVGSWKGKASSSQFRIPGTIFVSREVLDSPWQVAEYLFHESLHQKLYDFRQGHSVLAPNYWREDAPRVCSLWNVPDSSKSNYWDTHRALAAFHVYVHLSLLCSVAEQRAHELENVYGPIHGSLPMTGSRRAFERAHYLGEKTKELCWKELGLAGKRLLDWLKSVLDALDPAPPPHGSYIHLLLDLYQSDAEKVEVVLGRSELAPVSSHLHTELGKIIRNEVEITRSVLSRVNAQADLSRFDRAVAQYSDGEIVTGFSDVRRLISKTLLDLSPDGYRLRAPSPDSTDPDEIVKRMVQGSSRHLDAVLAR